MELHKALKEIIAQRGVEMMNNNQIINFLLDYQAFREKPATKLILRDVINAGYAEEILALNTKEVGWQTKFKQYEHEFIDSCGYKEELAAYVFEAIAYALGMNDGENGEPAIKPSFNIDSFFDIPEVEAQQPANTQLNAPQHGPDPTDLYTIALSFYNEGKYQQAKGFIEKAIYSQPAPPKIAHMLRLLGDILMMLGHYEDAIKIYNECFNKKAIEGRYAIDILKDYLNKHKIKGYENVMFNYFFCLYGAKRISNAQWLQFVKGEAIYGIIDAIRYCADNGINPVENHFDIYFTDRNQLKNLDSVYVDGTFAHELSNTKEKIGEVVLTETSDYEKSQGWSHGYIVGDCFANHFFGKMRYIWSSKLEDLPFPHAHYTEDDLRHWGEFETIESEQFITINNYNAYPAFNAIYNQYPSIPLNSTSGWFLPSIHTCKRIIRNYKTFGLMGIWTSSQADKNNAIVCDGPNPFFCAFKTAEYGVIPVAAF